MVFLIDDMGVMDVRAILTDENGKPKRYPLNDYCRRDGTWRAGHPVQSILCHERVFAANFVMTGQNAARHRATNWINRAAQPTPMGGWLELAW